MRDFLEFYSLTRNLERLPFFIHVKMAEDDDWTQVGRSIYCSLSGKIIICTHTYACTYINIYKCDKLLFKQKSEIRTRKKWNGFLKQLLITSIIPTIMEQCWLLLWDSALRNVNQKILISLKLLQNWWARYKLNVMKEAFPPLLLYMSIKVAEFEITNSIFLSPPRHVWASQVALVVKNPPVNAGETRDIGLKIPMIQRRFPGAGHGNPLQYSCLENPMDRGAWLATAHWFTKSQTWLKWLSTHTFTKTSYRDRFPWQISYSHQLIPHVHIHT